MRKRSRNGSLGRSGGSWTCGCPACVTLSPRRLSDIEWPPSFSSHSARRKTTSPASSSPISSHPHPRVSFSTVRNEPENRYGGGAAPQIRPPPPPRPPRILRIRGRRSGLCSLAPLWLKQIHFCRFRLAFRAMYPIWDKYPEVFGSSAGESLSHPSVCPFLGD
jgi:hypothetical protein